MLLDVGLTGSRSQWVGAHWVVAFAYTDDYVYMTNWGGDHRLEWSNFLDGWSSGITKTMAFSYSYFTI